MPIRTEPDHPTVVVAGNINLDIIPAFFSGSATLPSLLAPGKTINLEHLVTATGGSVSNTGIALHRLGMKTRLAAKIGNDSIGRIITDLIAKQDAELADGLIVSEELASSYTIVINIPTYDRTFWYYPGANDALTQADIPWSDMAECRLFHFGYPPLMRTIFSGGGMEMKSIFAKCKELGLTTSLDMAKPDPDTDAGAVDWQEWLQRVLPYTDLFLPSFEEILFMLDRPLYLDLEQAYGPSRMIQHVSPSLLHSLSVRLLDMGAAVVAIKLGDQGLYVKTTSDHERMSRLGRGASDRIGLWANQELLAPCFQVHVAGTTGAGDCTIAGFLTGLLQGYPLEQTMIHAVGVGAHSVEHIDGTSGIPSWQQVSERIKSGWEQAPLLLCMDGWQWDETNKLWYYKDVEPAG